MDHQAFAQMLGNYGEFFGAIAVVATLAYLAIQVRQNRLATLASTHHETIQGLAEVVADLKDPWLVEITQKIMDAGFQSLERGDQIRMSIWLCTFMWALEDAYFQWCQGNFSDRAWKAREVHMLDILTMREVDTWMDARKAWFDPEFVEFVQQRITTYRPSALMTDYEPEADR